MSRNETPQRTAGKRPLRALTPQEKLDAIKRVHEGESKASVARDIGVPESTLRGWCKAEHKILNQVNTMKNSGSFERISSPSESDRSTPGSSSHSPSATLTSGPSTSGVKESSEETESSTKRIKLDNETSSVSTAGASSSTSAFYQMSDQARQSFITHYLYNLMSQPVLKNTFFEQQAALINNKALLSNMSNTNLMDSGFSSSMYSTSNASLGNMAMMDNTIANMSAQRDINGRKTRHRTNVSTSSLGLCRNTFKKQNSSNRENLSIPSTSTSGNHMVGSTMPKPSQDGKFINDIAQQLLLRKQLKQQQSVNLNSADLLTQWVSHFPAMQNILDGRSISGNSVNNNNNIQKNNNPVENRKSCLPPGIHEAADHGSKFVTWLRQHGSMVFTFQQVKPVETIVEQLVAWANSNQSEIKSSDKSNSMS